MAQAAPGTKPTAQSANNLAYLQAYGEAPAGTRVVQSGDGATHYEPVAPEEATKEEGTPTEASAPEGTPAPPEVPVNNVKQAGEKAQKTILKIPSPGGLAFMVILLVVLFVLVLKVNGKTRAEWLLDVLIGRARIEAGSLDTSESGKGGTGSNDQPGPIAVGDVHENSSQLATGLTFMPSTLISATGGE